MAERNPYIGCRPADQLTEVDWWIIKSLSPSEGRKYMKERTDALVRVVAQREPRP